MSHKVILGQTAQEVRVCFRLIALGWEQAVAQTMDTGEVWFVLLLHEVSWTCHGAGVWPGAHPPIQPVLPLLPWSPSLGILHCQLAAPLAGNEFWKGGQVCPTWSPAPGSFEPSSVLPLPPNTCLTPGEPLNLSVLRQNKDNTTSFSLHAVCLLQIRCKLLRARFVSSVCSVPIKTEP